MGHALSLLIAAAKAILSNYKRPFQIFKLPQKDNQIDQSLQTLKVSVWQYQSVVKVLTFGQLDSTTTTTTTTYYQPVLL